jgi:hypothetical protein
MNRNLNIRINNKESFIVANDGEYLGKLTLNKFDVDSIYNEFGNYGSKYSATSIFNKFSNYGSPFSSLSPFNQFTSTPPYIYLYGVKYAYLSINQFLGFKTITPNELLKFIKNHNLNY